MPEKRSKRFCFRIKVGLEKSENYKLSSEPNVFNELISLELTTEAYKITFTNKYVFDGIFIFLPLSVSFEVSGNEVIVVKLLSFHSLPRFTSSPKS